MAPQLEELDLTANQLGSHRPTVGRWLQLIMLIGSRVRSTQTISVVSLFPSNSAQSSKDLGQRVRAAWTMIHDELVEQTLSGTADVIGEYWSNIGASVSYPWDIPCSEPRVQVLCGWEPLHWKVWDPGISPLFGLTARLVVFRPFQGPHDPNCPCNKYWLYNWLVFLKVSFLH